MTDPELIREAVKLSGLSSRAFAEEIVWRDERTVRRWNAGASPMPPHVRAKLEWFTRLTPAKRSTYVDAATAQAP